MSTLFAQILPIFTNQTERVATEALKHILHHSEPARNALERMLLDAGVEVGSLARFLTEASGEEGERVDLVCYDGDDTERVLVEAKFWAGLTDNQPNTYLARLPKDTHSALLFVAPAQRIETLWPELCRRAEEQHELRVASDTPMSGELRGVSIGDSGHKMLLTSWRAVLERMESQASIAGDRAAVQDIEQLYGLIERETGQMGLCHCGCGRKPQDPKRRNSCIGHDAKAKSSITHALRSLEPDYRPNPNADLRIPSILVERVKVDPNFKVADYTATDIIDLAENVGIR